MFRMNLECWFAKLKRKYAWNPRMKTRKQAGLCSLNVIALHEKSLGLISHSRSLQSPILTRLVPPSLSETITSASLLRSLAHQRNWDFHLRSACGGIKELFIFISVQLISPPVIRASSPSLSPQGLSSYEGQDRWRQMSLLSDGQSINNICSRYSCFNEINLEELNTVLRWITDHTREWFVSDYRAVR